MGRSKAARKRAARQRGKGKAPDRRLIFALIFILTAAILFVIAVFLGNYLSGLSNLPGEDEVTSRPAIVRPAGHFDKDAVPFLVGRAVPFEDPGDPVITAAPAPKENEETAQAPKDVIYSGASVNLRAAKTPDPEETADPAKVSSGMSVSFSSSSVLAHSYDAGGGPEPAPTAQALKKRYGYLSAVFEISYVNSPESAKLIMKEYEISLLTELLSCGFDDLILRGFGCGPGELEEAVSFVREILDRSGATETKIGVCLDFDFCESADARSRLNSLGFDCGFLAVDLSREEVPLLMTPAEVVRDRVSRIAEIVDLYGIRVIVGCGNPSGFNDEVYAAKSGGAMNIQAIIPA